MIRAQHFLAVLAARNREFLRDRSSWAWNVFFPFLLIAGLAVMFGSDNRPVYKVAVFAAAAGNQQQSAAEAFFETRHINFVDVPAIEPVTPRLSVTSMTCCWIPAHVVTGSTPPHPTVIWPSSC